MGAYFIYGIGPTRVLFANEKRLYDFMQAESDNVPSTQYRIKRVDTGILEPIYRRRETLLSPLRKIKERIVFTSYIPSQVISPTSDASFFSTENSIEEIIQDAIPQGQHWFEVPYVNYDPRKEQGPFKRKILRTKEFFVIFKKNWDELRGHGEKSH